MKAFQKVIAIVGENKETLNNLGSACAEHELYDVAADFYGKALSADPEYVLSLRNLGKLCMATEQYARALEMFERLVKKLPQDYEGNWLLAQCLRSLGRQDDALVQLEKLARIAPQSDEVYREMGMIYLEKGDVERPKQLFSKSLSLNPNQPELITILMQQEKGIEGRSPLPDVVPRMPGIVPPIPQLPLPRMPSVP